MDIIQGLKFRHFLSKNDVHYTISSIKKEKVLELNSDMIVDIIDSDGEYMGRKTLKEVYKLFETQEWIELI